MCFGGKVWQGFYFLWDPPTSPVELPFPPTYDRCRSFEAVWLAKNVSLQSFIRWSMWKILCYHWTKYRHRSSGCHFYDPVVRWRLHQSISFSYDTHLGKLQRYQLYANDMLECQEIESCGVQSGCGVKHVLFSSLLGEMILLWQFLAYHTRWKENFMGSGEHTVIDKPITSVNPNRICCASLTWSSLFDEISSGGGYSILGWPVGHSKCNCRPQQRVYCMCISPHLGDFTGAVFLLIKIITMS